MRKNLPCKKKTPPSAVIDLYLTCINTQISLRGIKYKFLFLLHTQRKRQVGRILENLRVAQHARASAVWHHWQRQFRLSAGACLQKELGSRKRRSAGFRFVCCLWTLISSHKWDKVDYNNALSTAWLQYGVHWATWFIHFQKTAGIHSLAGGEKVPLGLLMLGKHALDKIKLQFLSLDRVREINPACYSVNFPLSGTSVCCWTTNQELS